MNKLAFAEHGQQNIIRYNHHFRVDVGLFIRKANLQDRDWDLYFSNGNTSRLPQDLKEGLIREFMLYIRRRARKGVNKLRFGDFIEMTQTMNVA